MSSPLTSVGDFSVEWTELVLIVCSLERKSADLWMFADEQQTDDYLYLRLVLTAVLVVIVLLCPSLCRRISEIAERELALEEE